MSNDNTCDDFFRIILTKIGFILLKYEEVQGEEVRSKMTFMAMPIQT